MSAASAAARARAFFAATSRPAFRARPCAIPPLSARRGAVRISHGGSQGPRYRRNSRVDQVRYLWQQSPGFRYTVVGASGLGGVFYWYHIEDVPVSGRKRFNVVTPEMEEQMAMEMYQQTLQQYGKQVLPAWHPSSRMVQRVLNRLIPASGVQDAKWEVHVIEDPGQKNAFVMPGGKVFVFSGILPICQTDDGLAAVLGHEIAHNVAHHAAERMSQMALLVVCLYPLAWVIGAPDILSQVVLDFGFLRPGSRKQEAEADYIGLLMMAQSCYDPEAAIGLWQRMEQAEKNAPPQWMSTHPSSHNRVEKIGEWLPQAETKLEQSDCRSTLQYAGDFKQAFKELRS